MTALLWKTRLSGSSRRLPNFAKSSVRHRVTCLAALNCALTTIQKRIACAIPTASSTNASARMECGIGTGLWHWLRRRKNADIGLHNSGQGDASPDEKDGSAAVKGE